MHSGFMSQVLMDIYDEIYEKRIMHEQCYETFLWLGYGKPRPFLFEIRVNEKKKHLQR